MISALLLALPLLAAGAGVRPLIIDTDMGADDVMAIALILSHREIPVEAITVVDGVAHVPAGAANARRLVFASGRTGIKVFEGREQHLQRTAGLNPAWRTTADLPISRAIIPAGTSERAEAWLAQRLKDGDDPVRILALGPLTNVALALEGANPKAVEEIVMMGGAFRVPGNITSVAEANFFVDPEAAGRVFRSGVPIRVVPLDATNRVKIDRAFAAEFKRTAKGPLASIVGNVLDAARKDIAEGSFYAWDALAAAALLDPAVAKWTHARVAVRVSGDDAGRSVIESGTPNAQAALDADRKQFERIFLSAFAR